MHLTLFAGVNMVEIFKISDPSIYTVEDYDRIVKPLKCFTMRGLELYSYINKLSSLGDLFVAVEDNSIAGMIGFYANDLTNYKAYLSIIVVDSSFQGQGIGQKLLDLMFEICNSRGMKSISLNVVAKNEGAIKFYRRNGFEIAGKGLDSNRVTMTKYFA